jgi:hypothetical protein
MGDRRAGHGTVGRIAVIPFPLRRGSLFAGPLLLVALGGCHFAGDLVSAAAGGASAAATANPAVGIAVGVALNSGIDATTDYIVRVRTRAEQDAIAAQIATLGVGESRPWRIAHTIPIGNEHGEVWVTRVIATSLAICKELVFSVVSGEGQKLRQHYYSTEACQNGQRWKWALAEPSVERWGSLR